MPSIASSKFFGTSDSSSPAFLTTSGNLAGWAVDRISVCPLSLLLRESTDDEPTAVCGSTR